MIDLDPLLFATVTRGLTGGLDASFNGESFFRGAAEGLANSLLDTLTFGQTIGIDPLSTTNYIVNQIEFNKTASAIGVGNALKSQVTGYLFRDATVDIAKAIGEISKKIKDTFLSENEALEFNMGEGANLKVDKETGELTIEDKDGNTIMKLEAGEIYDSIDNSETMPLEGEEQISGEIKRHYQDGTQVITEIEEGEVKELTISVKGENDNAPRETISYSKLQNETKLEITTKYEVTEEERGEFLNKGYSEEDIAEFKEIYSNNGEDKFEKQIIDNKGQIIKEDNNVDLETWIQNVAEKASNWYTQFFGIQPPKTTISEIDERKVANVDMELTWPIMSKMAVLSTLSFMSHLTNANTNWTLAINSALPKVKEAYDMGARFLFLGGVNTTGQTLDNLDKMKKSLGLSEDKFVVAAHSAGTELAIKSAFLQKADKYLIMSPRMTTGAFEDLMQEAGISPDQVVIVTTSRDFANWPGDYTKYGGEKWTSIHIEDGPGIGWDPFKNHRIAVEGWLNEGKYKVKVNNGELKTRTLAEIYKEEINK